MTIAKIIEISSDSSVSFQDAIEAGIKRTVFIRPECNGRLPDLALTM